MVSIDIGFDSTGTIVSSAEATSPTLASREDGHFMSRRESRETFLEGLAQTSRIMVVDDESFNIMVVCKHLKDAGYRSFVSTTDPTEVLNVIGDESPDLIVLDIVMPGMNGLDLLELIRSTGQYAHLPVIILTGETKAETKLRALEVGATDFLSKPVDPSELVLRIRNALTVKAHHDQLAEFSERLDAEVRQRTLELEVARREAIHCLARASEYRDEQTGYHVARVGEYAAVIANELGMDQRSIEVIKLAAQLHDVRKIGVSDSILLKPGKLDETEFATMKQHCEYGVSIIQPLADEEWKLFQMHTSMGTDIMNTCSSPIMKMGAIIAKTHHEKWDGSGYPQGLSGEDIPIEGRITALADVFDALSSRRPYKAALPSTECFAILEDGRGTHFDPQVLDAFLVRKTEILQIQARYDDAS